MWVEHLSLVHFRNYEQADLNFVRGSNLLLGRNGQGKTNIAEAIAYFGSLSSHRVSQDSALIQRDQPSAIARMRVHRQNRSVLLELQLNREGPKRAQLNRNAVQPRELLGYFSSVVFAPEDLQIIRGEPSIRRRFVDELIAALNPATLALFADYERVVKQRTTLLKSLRLAKQPQGSSDGGSSSTLDIWNERLIELGARIIEERQQLLAQLREPLARSYALLVDADHAPELSLRSRVIHPLADVPRETQQIREAFTALVRAVSEEERERGMTLVGPHRDDIEFNLNGLPVKGFASHGESWSFVLALRLASAQLLENVSSVGSPVIILDDVFAELDQRRRDRLADAIRHFEQIIVTAAVEGDVPETLQVNTIRIENGRVVT